MEKTKMAGNTEKYLGLCDLLFLELWTLDHRRL